MRIQVYILTAALAAAPTGLARAADQPAAPAPVSSAPLAAAPVAPCPQQFMTVCVREVSEVNQKGRHTTTTAELIRLEFGGWVVDTPGVRQFELWDTLAEEVEGYFVEFRPFVALCGFPDCTHTHEERCAVKRAVDRRQISARRYTSYLGMFAGTLEE